MISVLTVTARKTSLKQLASALQRQKVQRKVQWVIVDSVYPERMDQVKGFVTSGLSVRYAPAPDCWARIHGYRYLAAIRNRSLLLAGDPEVPLSDTIVCGIDDDCIPESTQYLATLAADVKEGALTVPAIRYGERLKRCVSGNALMPLPLEDVLDINGYDEMLDANWPGTSTYEDVDLAFRLKTYGWKLRHRDELVVRHREGVDHAGFTKGVKCNHILRELGCETSWPVNRGEPQEWMATVLGTCRRLNGERCAFLQRKCELPLDLARFGHPHLRGFLTSRPSWKLKHLWKEWASLREFHTVVGG